MLLKRAFRKIVFIDTEEDIGANQGRGWIQEATQPGARYNYTAK